MRSSLEGFDVALSKERLHVTGSSLVHLSPSGQQTNVVLLARVIQVEDAAQQKLDGRPDPEQ